jgi:phosphoserine phosphatase RsbU/P
MIRERWSSVAESGGTRTLHTPLPRSTLLFVRRADVTSSETLPRLIEMLRELSAAKDAESSFAGFMRAYWKIRPVGYFVGVIPAADESPGAYRVTYEVDFSAIASGVNPRMNAPASQVHTLPLRRGGLIGELIATPEPKLLESLRLTGDAFLADRVASLRSCVALPCYLGREIPEWVIAFSPLETLPQKDFENALLVANFRVTADRQHKLIDEVRTLNAQLLRQYEEIARLQQALLPEKLPVIPGLELATSYLTSDQAGGDYYDFFAFADGRWGILIADASGHGPAAATVMAMFHAIVHAYDAAEPAPDRVLEFANARLRHARLDGAFITAFFAIYDPRTGVVEYSSAGHNPPRVKDGRTGAVRSLDEAQTLPLGILDSLDARTARVQLKPQDTLVLYTDGITEAFGPNGAMFGTDRLDLAIERCTGQPDCTVQTVHGDLYEHTQSRARADDQTLVALRYTV